MRAGHRTKVHGQKFDGRKLNSHRTNQGPAMATLSLAMLLLLRRYGAAARVRSDGAVAALASVLLELCSVARVV